MNQFNTSLWGDEGFSAILSMKPLPEILKIIATDTSPPLWNITEYIAFQLLGTSEIVIRGLAFFFFLLTIFFVYKIGALLWNKRAGLLAAALTFLNPFFFIYAFEGRMYSIMALGVSASMYFFLKIMLLKTKSKLDFIGYVIATLWALYSHHFALFVLIVQGLWFAYEFFFGKRDAAKRMFKAFIAIGVGYTPWLLPLYNQIKMVGEGFWLGTPDLQDLIGLITEYLAAGIRNTNLKIFGYHLHEASTLLVVVALFLRKWQKDIKKTLFLLSWFLGPILLTWIVSQKFQSIFFNRYLLYAIPGAMLTLASMGRKYSGIFIGILLLLFLRIDYHYFTHPTKLPFREMSAWVKETLRQDSGQAQKTVLINWNAGSHHLWETKYYGIPAPIYVPGGGELPFFVGTALMEEGDIINEIPENTRRVGVVTSSSIEEIDLPGYTEEERKEMDGLKFVWYLKE